MYLAKNVVEYCKEINLFMWKTRFITLTNNDSGINTDENVRNSLTLKGFVEFKLKFTVLRERF